MEAQGDIEPFASSPEELERLLAMARRKIADARLEQLSPESRLVCAYQAVLACATAALRSNDYRVPSAGKKHLFTLESLQSTICLNRIAINYCHLLRKKRHRDDYEGTLDCSAKEATDATAFAEDTLQKTVEYLGTRFPSVIDS